jgi:hypothetical protein
MDKRPRSLLDLPKKPPPPPLVIVDGMPCSGVHTLAQRLAQEVPATLRRHAVRVDQEFKNLQWTLQRPLTAEPLVIARCHLTAGACAGEEASDLTGAQWRAIDADLAARDAWLLCLVDLPWRVKLRLEEKDVERAKGWSTMRLGQWLTDLNHLLARSQVQQKGSFTLLQLLDPVTGALTPQLERMVATLRERAEAAR